jgi:DNA repair protein RadC
MTKTRQKTQHDMLPDLRQRFMREGLKGLRDEDKLNLILGYTSSGRRDLSSVSSALIDRFGDLRGVLQAGIEEIKEIRGITPSSALFIRLLGEVSKIYLKERIIGENAFSRRSDLINCLHLMLSGEKNEKFIGVFLNKRQEVSSIDVLHEGTINMTAVYPRKAIELSFRHNAVAVIFVHNHPSGDCTPSEVDKTLAKTLEKAAETVGIAVLDHIIIGRHKHFSSMEKGL